MTLIVAAARAVRENAHAPYSRFKVGAAIRAASRHASMSAAMSRTSPTPKAPAPRPAPSPPWLLQGETRLIAEVLRDRRQPRDPVPPCGGCRQKIAEFAGDRTVPVTLCTTDGAQPDHDQWPSFCPASLHRRPYGPDS